MPLAISVQNLSKKYIIRHASRERYATLRDSVPTAIRDFGRRLKRGLSSDQADTQEDFWALKNVSFEVQQGERVGIIGRNGAGKSTLLKLLSRISWPDEGGYSIAGRVSSLLEVGAGFHPELTGRENIYLNGALLGMAKHEIESRFDEIVAFAGVEKFIDTPVKRYSSGMYVRLAFSVAAHIDPDVLIIDEVLAVGDLQFQQRCMNRMKDLESAGRTVLFVTHNMEALMTLCDRAIVLDRGGVAFDGPAQEGRKAYLALQALRRRSVEDNSGRGGTGTVRVQSVDVVGPARDEGGQIVSGAALSFEVCYGASEAFDVGTPLELGIGIDSEEGTRLFTSRSSWEGVSYKFQREGGRFVCEIDALPLVPGTYLISVALIHQNETLDFVQHCSAFDVVDNNNDIYRHRTEGFGPLQVGCRFL